jgi:hypothetical protein
MNSRATSFSTALKPSARPAATTQRTRSSCASSTRASRRPDAQLALLVLPGLATTYLIEEGFGLPRGIDSESIKTALEVPDTQAGFVDTAELKQETHGGRRRALHVGVECAGLVVDLQSPLGPSCAFVEGPELEECFDAGDRERPAVVLVEPVVFETLGQDAAAQAGDRFQGNQFARLVVGGPGGGE